MNRGSENLLLTLIEKERCFNEAPIHESGKSPLPTARPPTLPRFNEAPIHESGKWQCAWLCERCNPRLQ